jgi:type II secretory pathway component PulF
VTLQQRIRFYQQLAVLTRAGLPMRTGLQRLRERISGRQINLLAEKISAGEMVGDAFAAAGFTPFECHLVTAGERSAQLDTVFQHLAEFWSRQREMFRALVSQLYYPAIIVVVALLLNAVVDLFLFSLSMQAAVIHLVEAFACYGGGGFVIYTLVKVSWSSDAAQRFWLALPIIGRALSTAYSYRWITAVKLEYSAGVPLPDAVADAWRASGYAAGNRLAEEGRVALLEGAELSTLVQKWRQLPRDWVDFIETGEVSGALETAFVNLEKETAFEWDLAQKRMNAWVPKLVYFIALLIAGAQIAVILFREIGGSYSSVNDAINKTLGQ